MNFSHFFYRNQIGVVILKHKRGSAFLVLLFPLNSKIVTKPFTFGKMF
jgi:hypothetical protein